MIEIRELTKDYGPTTAIDNVTFTVPDGSITAFLGPNGSGKSTTMRCTLGLDRPTSGTARIDGRRLNQHQEPARVAGAVLDTAWFHPGRSGRAHLHSVAASARIPLTRVEEVLDIVGLRPAARRRIGGYSLGMKQRLGLATAILGNPGNLILDEPMNGLDPGGIRWMRAFLREAADSGRAVLVSSHLLTEMRLTADRVVLIADGRLLGEWTTDEFAAQWPRELLIHTDDDHALINRLQNLGVRAHHAPSGLCVRISHALPDAAALSRLCSDMGLLVLALGECTDTLETAFLNLTSPDHDRTEHNA